MARKSGVAIRETTYGRFKGVDFSTDFALVDDYRSPLAVNMTADTGGMPEKRTGWRVLHTIEKPVNGLFYGVMTGRVHFVAHGGTKLYAWSGTEAPKVVKEGVFNGPSTAVNMGGKLWILTGGDYLCYDGETAKDVSETAYIPTTTIGAAPAGGGKPHEQCNLLQKKRRNEFIPDGTAAVYQLDTTVLDPEPVTATVWGEVKKETTDFTVDRAKGTVTFLTVPAKPTVGVSGGVVITFCKTVTGAAEKIKKCTIATTYGVGSSDRVVFSGNDALRNQDWTSSLNDPSYVPDLSYAVVGMAETAIVGYRRVGEHLAIIKEDNGQDSTIYMRSGGLSETGNAVFPVKQSIAGVGAVSKRGFGNILDEQLFLSGTGIYAITANTLTAERIVQNRSFFVDSRLTREPHLENAAAVNYGGMFLLAINHHVYLLDGRQDKTYRAKSQGDYVYECYYWDNVPAICWMNFKDCATEQLYFGTAEGQICRFNSDLPGMNRYRDGTDMPIDACWSTKADDDGDITLLKTMIKKGNSVTIKPYTRSSARVCFRTEQDPTEWQATEDTLDIFDWSDIDFGRFTFNSNDAPREILFNTKVKKYKRLQIIIRNNALDEGFGLFGITKHFVVGNFAKR